METIVRTLRPHVEGLYLVKALEVKRPCVLPEGLPLSEAEGLRLDGVSRRGKLILMNLDTGEEGRIMHVVLHLRMTGSLLAQDREAPFDADAMPGMAGKYTRCLFGFARTPEGPCTELVRFDDIRTFGRVLVGFDVPQSQNDAFQEYLDRGEAMGYPYVEETDNDAYRLFLGYHGKNK